MHATNIQAQLFHASRPEAWTLHLALMSPITKTRHGRIRTCKLGPTLGICTAKVPAYSSRLLCIGQDSAVIVS